MVSHRTIAALGTAACFLLTGAGCGASDEVPGSGGNTTATTTSTSHSGAKIHGWAVVTDDVGTVSSSPMLDSTLGITRLNAADALWEAIDFAPPDPQLPYVSGLIEDAGTLFTQLVAVDEGLFAFDVPDGDYLVCLLDGTGPYALTGCGVATVAGATVWTVSRGEGGLEVSSSG